MRCKNVIVDSDYMTFPYKIKVDRCVGSCNDVDSPCFKVCLPDIVKNISVKVFELISQRNGFKKIEFHKSYKCDCLLNETVCNDQQKWNKDKCRCECLKIEKCDVGFSWNVVNCRCEFKKAAKLMEEEKCKEITDIKKK